MESSEEREKPVVFDISSLDTYLLLRFFISVLSEKAWQDMGLRAKSGTDKIEKNLLKAKTAIDSIEFLINTLEPQLQEDEKKSFRDRLADLKINFVRQTK
jgi:hypothetical protein